MTGFELRLWRKGMEWNQGQACEELGVSLRTYQAYEKKGPPRVVELATQAISLRVMWPDATVKLRAIAALVKH